MPYYIINNQPVFLSWEHSRKLNEIVSNDKGSVWRIASQIHGHKESEEKSKLVYEELNKIYFRDPDNFKTEWIEFDLKGKKASENIWDLLYDYCHFFGFAFLTDLRDYPEKFTADYKGELYSYPMGRVFALNHFMKSAKMWWKFNNKNIGRTVRVIIDINKVNRLQGSLSEFIVTTNNYKLFCGINFEIHPV